MKNKILMLVLTCLLLDVISFQAQADVIYLGAWTKHFQTMPYINTSSHNLIGYEHDSYMVSYYKNSYGDMTWAFGKRFEIYEGHNIKASLLVGFNYGYYDKCQQDTEYKPREDYAKAVCPTAVPEIVYTRYKTQIAISLLGNAIAIGPRWEF